MKQWMRLGIIGAAVLLAAASLVLARVQAASYPQEAAPRAITSDQQCLDCHSAPDQVLQLASGESLYLTIDKDAFHSSLHGQKDVGCTKCHANITAYPHPALEAKNAREVTIQFSANCEQCHTEQAIKQHDSIHEQERTKGNENAAACSDCHNPHYTQKPDAPRSKIQATCGRCHSGIAQDYRQSVHGQALLAEENADVPICTDCHGVHNISDPRTAKFLLNSPKLCASCHTDAAKMARYGLNTNVVNTYVADFHGTTVTLFEQKSPDQLPNTPLCIDCHGIHDIKLVTDVNSTVIKQNLLTTCQKCHPNASGTYSDAWLSHYTPSPQHNALVFYVQQFYQFFVPIIIGGMALIVAADAGRRIVDRVKGARQ